jgi:hypothetical protein
MKTKALVLAGLLIAATSATAQESPGQVDAATVDAIRAAAQQMAEAARSVQLAIDGSTVAENRYAPATPRN